MKDLPWDEIQTIINCSQDGFPYQNIQLPEGFEEKSKVHLMLKQKMKYVLK